MPFFCFSFSFLLIMVIDNADFPISYRLARSYISLNVHHAQNILSLLFSNVCFTIRINRQGWVCWGLLPRCSPIVGSLPRTYGIVVSYSYVSIRTRLWEGINGRRKKQRAGRIVQTATFVGQWGIQEIISSRLFSFLGLG